MVMRAVAGSVFGAFAVAFRPFGVTRYAKGPGRAGETVDGGARPHLEAAVVGFPDISGPGAQPTEQA